jgi:hypothetical protein
MTSPPATPTASRYGSRGAISTFADPLARPGSYASWGALRSPIRETVIRRTPSWRVRPCSEVTLRGEVRSWAERDQAQASAWSAPGVPQVDNQITVRV